ncbi:MAG TPA: TonB-dependent receptor plug domain-containing protein [Nitrococcus sp.]|nr:TonB-dependent receptor plug domain-containing protein [Nitrococcus sp.]
MLGGDSGQQCRRPDRAWADGRDRVDADPGRGAPSNQIPVNIQRASGNAIERQNTIGISQFLHRNLAGVTVNAAQENTFQPDVSFRGFTASPLLGTPQGLAVYVDGVRVNEPFGDVVNWDLILANAIQSIDLLPGSNPVFGLNNLGGALVITMKNGFDDPGITASGYTGSFDRDAAEAQFGAHGGGIGYFLAANALNEDGWRDHSPSRLRQLMMRTDLRPNPTTRLNLSYTGARRTGRCSSRWIICSTAITRLWACSVRTPSPDRGARSMRLARCRHSSARQARRAASG